VSATTQSAPTCEACAAKDAEIARLKDALLDIGVASPGWVRRAADNARAGRDLEAGQYA